MSGSDERFEEALRGAPPSPGDPLDTFVRDAREAFPASPMLAEEAHLAAVADAAREIAAESRPATGRKESRVRIPRFRSLAAKIVAALVVVMSSFGGLAVAGALPGGVQNGVANVAAGVGLNLPGGDDESDDATEFENDAVESEAPEPTETEAPEADETDAPEADDQGENEQSGDQGDDQESTADDTQGQDEQSGDQSGDQESNSTDGEDGGGSGEGD